MCRCRAPAFGRRGALFATALLPAGLASGTARAEAYLMPRLRLAPMPGGPPRVALTLDACSGHADLRVLGGLMRLGLPATVFVTARWLRSNPDVVTLLLERPDLFSLQNHGARHVPTVLGHGRLYGIPVAGTIEAVRAEVEGGSAAILAAGAPPPSWFRGATALYSPAALVAIRATGLRVAGFSVNGDEGASLNAARVAARIAAARDGDVVIAHTNHPERPSGPGVVEGAARLADRGVRLVRLDTGPFEEIDAPPRA
jgi:peptidoglycan/xylan/chitin deacetylase (PgdA/CDA1 family)